MTVEDLVRASVEVIREGQSESGAYVAAPTFPPYGFSWLRDGAFIAEGMSRVGQRESAERFFDWTAGVILSRLDRLDAGEYLHARYTLVG